MNQNEMVQSLRAEISKLQRALDALLDEPSTPEPVRPPGRPSGSTNRAISFNPEEFAPKKRTMSAEGKARIAAAQKKRWAAQKGSSVSGAPGKKSASSKRTSKGISAKGAGKVAPTKAKKSTRAGKTAGSTQIVSAKGSASTATRKSATKKTPAKRTIRSASKRPAKQIAAASPQDDTDGIGFATLERNGHCSFQPDREQAQHGL